MNISIYNVLESMGLGLQKRALHLTFSSEPLNHQVFIQRIEGWHEINSGLKLELLCLSTSAHIPLKNFIAQRVAVDQVTDRGELQRLTGLVTAAAQGQSDGALTLYRLTVEDATSLWHKRRNSRVFMNKSVPELTAVLFSEWQQKSPVFASSMGLDTTGLSREYDVRPFIMQFNETDYEFLTRLWRSEGINWLVDESVHQVAVSADSIELQKLRLMDDNSHFSALPRRNIRYHRSQATEQSDTIVQLTAQRYLQSSAVHIQRWQPDSLAQQESTVCSSHLCSDQPSESLSLEQAWTVSPAWTADLKGADQSTQAGVQQQDRLGQQLAQYHDLQSKHFNAAGSVRDVQTGYWFELNGHPEIDQHDSTDREFLILARHFYNQNNLPKDIAQQIATLTAGSGWKTQPDERQACELKLIRRSITVVPEYSPLEHRPVVSPQRAKVTGPAGESIHVDAWGRVKVRFLFTRNSDHLHDGGAGSNDSDTDSAWVDVLTPWAGEGYGTRFHPRTGEIVVIDFFEGDPDRPFVTGRIHEAERHQTMFDELGQLPDTRKLSGIRSKEVNGAGFNQLRFDDTTGQISTQLHSSHGASQLNLGNLSHPKDKESSPGRGEGFELRTDAYGAMRAGKGLLISTYGQEQAVADHLDAVQAQSLLNQGSESMKMLSETAVKQKTDALNVIHRLPKLIGSLELKGTNDALQATVDLFKKAVSSDPITALKSSGDFIDDIQTFGTDTQNIVNEFKDFFDDAKESVENLKDFIENIEEHGSDILKGKLICLKDKFDSDPLGTLKDVGKVLGNIEMKDFDLTSGCGTFSKGSKLDINPMQALSSLQGFMEGYTQGLENSSDHNKQEQGKIFRQALMLLASPNGIALTTPEDIVLQATQNIAESSGASINMSAQRNIVAQAQEKISLFAAQKGFSVYAARGKVELQAQDDAIEAIARKVIKLISTEDKIEMTSPKEIVLTAGGSQLVVNGSGVFIKTGGKFEVKAGQHSFTSGEKVSYEVPELPNNKMYSNRLDIYDLFWDFDLPNLSYVAKFKDGRISSGSLDENGRTARIGSDSSEPAEVFVDTNADWVVEIEEDDLES